MFNFDSKATQACLKKASKMHKRHLSKRVEGKIQAKEILRMEKEVKNFSKLLKRASKTKSKIFMNYENDTNIFEMLFVKRHSVKNAYQGYPLSKQQFICLIQCLGRYKGRYKNNKPWELNDE